MKVQSIIISLVLCITLDKTSATPVRPDPRCLNHPYVQDLYTSRGCKLNYDNPKCVVPEKCPNGCVDGEGKEHHPYHGAWAEGRIECRCFFASSMPEMNFRLPKDLSPEIGLPNFYKSCQKAGCRVSGENKVVPVGEAYSPVPGRMCNCIDGPNPLHLDSIEFYHLDCRQVDKHNSWPIAPEMSHYNVVEPPKKTGGDKILPLPILVEPRPTPKHKLPYLERGDKKPFVVPPLRKMVAPSVTTPPLKYKVPKLPMKYPTPRKQQ